MQTLLVSVWLMSVRGSAPYVSARAERFWIEILTMVSGEMGVEEDATSAIVGIARSVEDLEKMAGLG